MSHFTTIQTQIKDIDALRHAVHEMELTLLSNAQARGFVGGTTIGEYVVKLKGPYDIAVNRQPGGAYALSCDWWDGHVEKEVGKNFGKLLQIYGVHKATMEAKKKGYSVIRKAQQDGAIKLTLMSL
jgi:hypothetical protein